MRVLESARCKGWWFWRKAMMATCGSSSRVSCMLHTWEGHLSRFIRSALRLSLVEGVQKMSVEVMVAMGLRHVRRSLFIIMLAAMDDRNNTSNFASPVIFSQHISSSENCLWWHKIRVTMVVPILHLGYISIQESLSQFLLLLSENTLLHGWELVRNFNIDNHNYRVITSPTFRWNATKTSSTGVVHLA